MMSNQALQESTLLTRDIVFKNLRVNWGQGGGSESDDGGIAMTIGGETDMNDECAY